MKLSAQICRLAKAVVTSQCDVSKSRALSNGNFGVIFASRKCSREQAPNDSSQFQYIMWWLKWKSVLQKRRLWWVCKFAQACLSLRNSIRIPCACSIGGVCVIYARRELRLWAFCQSNKYQTLLLARNALSLSYMTSTNALAGLHIRKGSTEPSSLYQNFMCWLKWRLVSYLYEQRRLWRVCTSKYNNGVQPSLRYFNAHFKVMKILNKTNCLFYQENVISWEYNTTYAFINIGR